MSNAYEYEGGELELFSGASNWKGYLQRLLAPFIRGEVLEVGAGIGGTTVFLRDVTHPRWTCLEPDATLAERLERRVHELPAADRIRIEVGTVDELAEGEQFDSVIYIDVLEHIADDARELARAARRLRPGGRVVVLSPAHAQLFTPFDAAVGHYRRYTRRTLRALTPPGLELERCFYADAVGLLASLGNKLLLRKSMPSTREIRLWDGWMVPISMRLDPLVGHRVGKSVIAVWRRPDGAPRVDA